MAADLHVNEQWHQFLEAAKSNLQTHDFKAALSSINQAILSAPQEYLDECYGLRGFVRLNLREFSAADDDCTAAIELSPANDEFYIWRGSARGGMKRWMESVIDLRRAVDLNPENDHLCSDLIRFSAESAIDEIRKIAVAGNLRPENWYQRAFAYRALGQRERAIRDVNLALRASPDDTEYRLLRGELMLELDQVDKAIGDLTMVVDNDRMRRGRALRLRASAYAKVGRKIDAFQDLDRVKALSPNSVTNLMECGQVRFGQNDYTGAVKEYSSVIKLKSDHAEAYFERGLAYAAMGNHSAADKDFTKAIELEYDLLQALIHRGKSRLERRLCDQAIADFQQVVKIDEASTEGLIGMARGHFAKQRWQEAGRICNTVLRLNPRNAAAFVIKGGVHHERKEYDSAILAFSRALELTHDEETIREAYYRRGISRVEAKLLDDAILDFNQLLSRSTRHAGAMFWRANAEAKKGAWLASLEDIQNAIDMKPDFADQYRKLGTLVANKALDYLQSLTEGQLTELENRRCRGMAYLLLGKYEKAIRAFSRYLKIEPEHALVIVRRGQAYLFSRDFAKATKDFERAIQLDHSNLLARENLAACLMEMDDRKGALVEYTHAIRLRPDDDRLYVERGRIHAARGRKEKARDDFMQAIAIRPANYEAYRERGWLYAMLGKYRNAVEDFDVSIEIFSKQPELIARRGELQLKRNRFKEARADFELAVTIDPLLVRAHCGRALAMVKTDEHEQALIWLTKAIHRFHETDDLVEIISTRARVFFGMARCNRAIADYSTVIELLESVKADPRRIAPSYYARGIAHFHYDNLIAAQEDWEQSMLLSSEQKLGSNLLRWLANREADRPSALRPLTRSMRPTRPPIVHEAMEVAAVDKQWEAVAPYDLWLVKLHREEAGRQMEFGPVPLETLTQWCEEGRLHPNTRLLRADWDIWRRASSVYPALLPAGLVRVVDQSSASHDSVQSSDIAIPVVRKVGEAHAPRADSSQAADSHVGDAVSGAQEQVADQVDADSSEEKATRVPPHHLPTHSTPQSTNAEAEE
jgi:tetratricopeptide (TPR) repeat protein